MKRKSLRQEVITFGIACFSLTLFSCKKDGGYDNPKPPINEDVSVLTASGDSSAIIGTIQQFRHLLGDTLNTVPGKTVGRREVNWDGVPPAFTNANNFPPDFFNSNVATDPAGRKRGIVYTNTGAAFRVDSSLYAEIDPSYATQFQIFSRKRLFVNAGNNVTSVSFKIPGTATDAFVKGFGVIFSDVDIDNSTYVEFFNGNNSLGIFKAPTHPAGGSLSFLGVYFKNEKVTSLKITSGNALLATGAKDISDGGNKDLVVMDDFFYSEPNAL